MAPPTDPASVADVLAIQTLYAAYNHAIDYGEAADFAACFTSDGSLDTGLTGRVEGTEALADFAAATQAGAPGLRHLVFNLVVDVDGDRASGQAYLLGQICAGGTVTPVVTGRYHDTLTRTDGGWRFATRVLTPDP